MPADIVTRLTAPDSYPAVTVETKATLNPAASWTPQPYLRCNALETRVNGNDQCQLSYEIGARVRQIEAADFAPAMPLDLIGQFVQVTIATTPQVVWHGVITDDSIGRDAVVDDNGTNRLVGKTQQLTARGLEYLLSRTQVDSAVVASIAAPPVRLLRPLGFNTGSISPTNDQQQRGNRNAVANYDNTPAFENGVVGAQLWRADEMLAYLLAYHTPLDDAGGVQPVRWTVDVGLALALSSYAPSLRTENRTVLQLINAIVSPRRGFCWWLGYDPTGNGGAGEITLYGETLTPDAINLPAGGSLPANVSKLSVDFDGDERVQAARVSRQDRERYTRIVCRGARMTSTFTVGPGDGTLEPDWSSEQETEYKAGAGGTDAAANDAARRSPLLDRVYSAFRIPALWGAQSGDGAGAAAAPAFPDLSPTGSVLGSLPVRPQGLRVLHQTRLQTGFDYADPQSITDNNPAGSPPAFEPPIAIVQVEASPDRYQFVDRLSDAGYGGTPVDAGPLTSYHLHAQRDAPGVVFRASEGLAHRLARNHWGGAGATDKGPQLDYDTIRVTLCAEADAYCEGAWPETPPAGERIDELVITAGEAYRLDFLARNTVVALSGGAPVTAASGKALRDDRDALRDLARLAFEWYEAPRQVLSVSWRRVAQWQTAGNTLLGLGAMVTTIGDGATQETVNTVVGEVVWDLVAGTTTVKTLSAAIDIPELIA